jgi:hypothetical protein
MKKLMFAVRSLFERGTFDRAAVSRNVSRQLCIDFVWCPYRTVLLSDEHAPPIVSCLPHVSATMVKREAPEVDRSFEPVDK